MQQVYGLEMPREAAVGFGGGIAGAQDVCGAIAGGVIAAGLALGRTTADPEALRRRAYRVSLELYRRFKAQFGGPDCSSLTGYDFLAPGGYEKYRASGVREERCYRFVAFVVETLAELEEERRAKEAPKG